MATLSTEELKQLIDVSDSFAGVFNTKKDSDFWVNFLQELHYEVVVPNITTEQLSGKTYKAIIRAENEYYFYPPKPTEFYIVIGGKTKQVGERIISTETQVVPVTSEEEVQDVVKKLETEGYTVFSPTQPPPVLGPKPNITGETEEIIFDESHHFSPPFPKIPSPIKPTEQEYLWVVVGVKKK